MSFQAGGDLCLGFFQTFWDDGLLPEIPQHGKVLEIGCAEADWLSSMRKARPDLHLTGIDWRKDARLAADVRIVGDVLAHEFALHDYDAIIAVSMLEWCGVGKYGDPTRDQGDRELMRKAWRWLKPNGWCYFDVPYAATEADKLRGTRPRNGIMRVYTDDDLDRRICGPEWQIVTKRYFEGRLNDGPVHPDGPYVACLLRPR